jgi:cyanophycinase-like exopeptidase
VKDTAHTLVITTGTGVGGQAAAQAGLAARCQRHLVQTALDDAAARGVPIGGTSAGSNVLSQLTYSAEDTSGAVSSDVLANPYSSEISLDKNFLSVPSLSRSQPVAAQAALPYLENTIVDPHFFERDRMGRTVTFLARLVEDPQWTPPSAPGGPTPLSGTMDIGIDQSTALLIDTVTNTLTTAGDATVIGNSPTNHFYAARSCYSGLSSHGRGQLNSGARQAHADRDLDHYNRVLSRCELHALGHQRHGEYLTSEWVDLLISSKTYLGGG